MNYSLNIQIKLYKSNVVYLQKGILSQSKFALAKSYRIVFSKMDFENQSSALSDGKLNDQQNFNKLPVYW